MQRRFGALKLNLPIPPGAKILSLEQHQNYLVIGLDSLRLLSVPLIIRDGGIIEVAESKMNYLKMKDLSVRSVKSCHDICLVHLVNDRNVGPLLDLTTDFQKSHFVDKSVEHFSVDRKSTEKMVAVARGTKVKVITFDGKKWSESFQKDIQKQILSLAIQKPFLYVATPLGIIVIDMKSGETSAFSFEIGQRPFVMAVDSDEFFAYSGAVALVLNSSLATNFPPIPFGESALDHCYTGKLYASVVADSVVLYDFCRMKGISQISGARHVLAYSGDLLVASEKNVFVVLDVTETIEDIRGGSQETANGRSLEILFAVFDQLWLNGERRNALSMLKIEKFREALHDVLSLFLSLEFPAMPPSRLVVTPFVPDNETLVMLADVLIELNEFGNVLLNTAVVELLAITRDTGRMSKYLSNVSESQILDEVVKLFLEKQNPQMLGYYFRAMKKYTEALELFKSRDDVLEVKNTIIANGSDFSFVALNIDWVMDKDPLTGIQVFGDTSISCAESIEFARNTYPQFYLGILRMLVFREDVPNHAELANLYCKELLEIIYKVCDSDFDRSRVLFCTCVIKNPNASIEEIRDELSENLTSVIRHFTSDITSATKALFDNVPLSSLRITLYTLCGDGQKALDQLWREHHDFEACEELCRSDSCLAMHLLSMAKSEVQSDEFIALATRLIKSHITKIDVPTAMSLIHEDTDLSAVADFLQDCYWTLHGAVISAQLKASFAVSEAFESDVAVVKSSLPVIELDDHKTCCICGCHLGFTTVHRTPSGQLCHEKCVRQDTS